MKKGEVKKGEGLLFWRAIVKMACVTGRRNRLKSVDPPKNWRWHVEQEAFMFDQGQMTVYESRSWAQSSKTRNLRSTFMACEVKQWPCKL